jgi:cardiolipin synthase (CMP-forming)
MTASLWTVSNGISLFRMLLAAPVWFLLEKPNELRVWIIATCLLAYVSDLLDGYLARKLNQVSEYGKMIDPLADKVFVAVAVLQIMRVGLLPVWFFVIVVSRDVLIFSAGMVLKSLRGVVLQSTMTGKAAVVSIGLTILAALFREMMPESAFSLILATSLCLQAATLIVYGKRLVAAMKILPR